MTQNVPYQGMKKAVEAVYLYATTEEGDIRWLTRALEGKARVVPVALDPIAVAELVARLQPQVLFIDYSNPALQSGEGALSSTALKAWPHIQVIATGRPGDTKSTLAALRNGADDFIFVDSEPADVQAVLQVLSSRQTAEKVATRGHTIAILGGRAGMGASTLACNLAIALQEACATGAQPKPSSQQQGVALLDTGAPVRDGLLYLGEQSNFSFVDGVKNFKRLDRTLLQTTLTHHSSGTAILPMPNTLSDLRDIAYSESVTLIRRMADFYDFLVTDFGGFTTNSFVAQAVTDADTVWVVCDQSIGGIVSTASLLRDMQERGVDINSFKLVLNKFNPHINLPAEDVATRLGIPLGYVIPDRATALLMAASSGKLIYHHARTDAYVLALKTMVQALRSRTGADPHHPADTAVGWTQRLPKWLGKKTP
jgi:pilus assembly protein CpaE